MVQHIKITSNTYEYAVNVHGLISAPQGSSSRSMWKTQRLRRWMPNSRKAVKSPLQSRWFLSHRHKTFCGRANISFEVWNHDVQRLGAPLVNSCRPSPLLREYLHLQQGW